MVGNSATEALREMIDQMKKILGEWSSEEDIVASLVVHIIMEIQV